MFIHNNAFKEFILAGKVIVDSAQRKPRMLRDLPHGCGMIAMLHEQFNGGVFDGEAGSLTFGGIFIFFYTHNFLLQ
jgi:hypothetical protein